MKSSLWLLPIALLATLVVACGSAPPPPAAPGNPLSVEASFIDPSGAAVQPAQVFAFDPVLKTLKAPDSFDGTKYIFLFKRKKDIQIIGADPRFAAVISPRAPGIDSRILHFTDAKKGSVVAETGSCKIPGMKGRLSPVVDASGKPYLYAENISINSGQLQPFKFTLGDALQLIDVEDSPKTIWIPFVSGQVSVVNYAL